MGREDGWWVKILISNAIPRTASRFYKYEHFRSTLLVDGHRTANLRYMNTRYMGTAAKSGSTKGTKSFCVQRSLPQ